MKCFDTARDSVIYSVDDIIQRLLECRNAPLIHGALSANSYFCHSLVWWINLVPYKILILCVPFNKLFVERIFQSRSFRYMKLTILNIDPAQNFGKQRLKSYASENEVLKCVIAWIVEKLRVIAWFCTSLGGLLKESGQWFSQSLEHQSPYIHNVCARSDCSLSASLSHATLCLWK